MYLREEGPPEAALPVTQFRAHLRLGTGFEIAADAAEDAALAGFLRAAIANVEARTGKVLLEKAMCLRLEDWRDRLAQPLPVAPVTRIDAILIDDGVGGITQVDAGLYRLRPCTQRPQVVATGVVLPHVPRRGGVEIRFTAGFGAWSDVPPDLAQAVMLLATRYYEDRSFEGSASAMPFGVSALIERWRAVRSLAGSRAPSTEVW